MQAVGTGDAVCLQQVKVGASWDFVCLKESCSVVFRFQFKELKPTLLQLV